MAKVVSAADLQTWITANQYDEATNGGGGTTPPEPSGEPVPVGFTGNFELTFREEFDGSSLDMDIWEPNWLAGNDTAITKPINSKELACFDPKQVKVANGALRIDAISKRQTATDGKSYQYTSGCVTSAGAKEFTPPVIVEFRARMHCPSNNRNQPYNWPATWLNGHHGEWPDKGENDVMENLRGGVCPHYHNKEGNIEVHQGGNELPSNTDYSAWHTFACEWTSDKLEYRYDGTVVMTISGTDKVNSAPNYAVINLGISDQEGGAKMLPGWFEVDYMRAWRRV